MFCVKDSHGVGAGEVNEGIAIARPHFDAALGLLTAAHATPEPRHLLLAG
jgi:hypothetical protein